MKMVYLIFFLGVVFSIDVDKNTFSNYQDVKLEHLHIEWLLNLNSKIIDGCAEYSFKVTT